MSKKPYDELGGYSGEANTGMLSKDSGSKRQSNFDPDKMVSSADSTENEEYADSMIEDDENTLDSNDFADDEEDNQHWLQLAQDAYRSSSGYLETNYGKSWRDSIDLFNSNHPSDSKYNNPIYEKRSKVFRPKTRAIIRKTEAAGAAAYFSNQDVISIEAMNQSDKQHVAGAAIMKELLQYRLKKSIKWFQTVQGALQDAQVTGVACAHVYWNRVAKEVETEVEIESNVSDSMYNNELRGYQGENEQSSSINPQFTPITSPAAKKTRIEMREEVTVDEPCIDLIPVEYIRVHPAASWIDPVNSSPFIIELIPMYVVDVKRKMLTGAWKRFDTETILRATDGITATLNALTRMKNKENPYAADSGSIKEYSIVWIQRHIHRTDDDDYEFYTLGDVALLTEPKPLSDSVFHGKRPYIIGNCNLETHKTFPSTIPEMSFGLQEEANEIANQRLDNVKFVLNKRYIVKRNKQVDIQALLKNVPGGVIAVDDVQNDIKELNYPDVTQSSYAEQDRINMDMDELLGNFSSQSVGSNRAVGETAKGMALMNSSANVMIEYLLRTFTETFIEPVLRQLVLLEQHYETDETVLALAGQKAQAFEKFGISENLDQVLQHELALNVNVGMGATDPSAKINKLSMGLLTLQRIAGPAFSQQIDFDEVTKEVFGALGYSDGSRFIRQGANPQLAQAQQIIQQLQMKLKTKENELMTKTVIAREANQTKLSIAGVKEQNQNQRFLVDHLFDKQAAQNLQGDQTMKPVQAQTAQKQPPAKPQ